MVQPEGLGTSDDSPRETPGCVCGACGEAHAEREEWRVVDRWWTEEPVSRRYFEVVLESGQNVVVFRDQERGGWFSQRGA